MLSFINAVIMLTPAIPLATLPIQFDTVFVNADFGGDFRL